MKLLRYGEAGREKPGLLDASGRIRDLSDHVADIDGRALAAERLCRLGTLDPDSLPPVEGSPRLGPPVAGVGNILGIGINYAEQVAGKGMTRPDEPVLFFKAVSALSGPYDPVIIPKGSQQIDWEVELAVIIGRKAQYVEEREALDYVAGYAVINDVSDRAFQDKPHAQWIKGKSFDTFAPLGPWLVTRDEVPDANRLDLSMEVNGVRRQNSNTSDMIFDVPRLISHLSHCMTLMPCDVIATGTPTGLGMNCEPPVFLEPGDVMCARVEGLGEQRQTMMSWEDADRSRNSGVNG